MARVRPCRPRRLLLSAGLLCALASAGGRAQDFGPGGLEPSGLEELPEPEEADTTTVVVTAERKPQKASDTASALTVVEGKEVADRAAADLTGVLEDVPGLDVQSMGPGGYGANVSIRGSTDFKPGGFGNRVLVLLDGLPLNNPDADGVDWSAVPMLDIERIEILRGPASALYGSAAMGGVIHLFSKPPVTGGALELGQGFSGWDGNRTRVTGSASWRGEDLGGRVSGWLQRYAGMRPAGWEEFRFNSDSESYGLRLNAEGLRQGPHRLTGTVSFSGVDGGNPGFEGTSETSRSRRFSRDGLTSGLRYRYDARHGFSAEGTLFWSRFRGEVADPDGGNPNLYSSDRVGVRGESSFLLGRRLVNTAGFELQVDRVGGSVFQLGVSEQSTRLYQMLAGALFAQTQIDLGAGLEATAGLRLDGRGYDTHQRFFSVSPKVRLAYRPDPATVLWAAVNHGYRVPTIGELYLRYQTTYGLLFQGNPALTPETVWAFEIGGRKLLLDGKLVLELVGFVNLGIDTIEFVYSTPVTAVNLDESRMLGVELSAHAHPATWLELHGALSTLDARDPEDGSAMLYRPAAKGSLAVVLKRWSWELAGRLQWVGERLFDDFLDGGAALPDPVTGRLRFPRRTLEAYALLDVDLRWRGRLLEVALHLTNLLDSHAYVIQGYPPPGREWFLEARIPWP